MSIVLPSRSMRDDAFIVDDGTQSSPSCAVDVGGVRASAGASAATQVELGMGESAAVRVELEDVKSAAARADGWRECAAARGVGGDVV